MNKKEFVSAGEILLISIDSIISNPLRSRMYYNDEQLTELMLSIEENGIIEPISVTPAEDEKFRIISGERRYKAAVMAGMEEIPCIIYSAELTESALFSLINNQQQRSLNYFEEAEALDKLHSYDTYDIKSLSQRLSKPESYILSRLRYLSIPEDIRKMMIENGLTENYASIIMKAKGNKKKKQLVERIAEEKLTLAEANNALSDNTKKHKGKIITLFKDITIFSNTIDKAIETLKSSGMNAISVKNETETYVEYNIRIYKPDKRT